MAIIKVTFRDLENDKNFSMLFGDSYKSWKEQLREYMSMYKGKIRYVMAYKSNAKWKGWGGLKWCSEEDFQEELNREGVQDSEPNNPKARLYSKMRFEEYDIEGKVKFY